MGKFSTCFLIVFLFTSCIVVINPETINIPIPLQIDQLPQYTFPETIDPSARYLFYLHGKIIEDQDLPAVSDEYGEYQYNEILETFSEYGFTVISEVRP